MIKGDRNIDLKEEPAFVEQYVLLRNRYSDLLLTPPVNVAATKIWLKRDDVEVRGIICANVLMGAVILFLSRQGEIAFFAKTKSSGIGSRLLMTIDIVAQERGLREVWAWVLYDNYIAQRVFEKNGFEKIEICSKEFQGSMKSGIKYKKCLK